MSDAPDRVDVLSYRDGEVYRAVGAGHGDDVVEAHEHEAGRRRLTRIAVGAVVALVVFGYGLVTERALLGVVAALIVAGGFYVGGRRSESPVPELVERDIDRERAERQYDLEHVTADPTAGEG